MITTSPKLRQSAPREWASRRRQLRFRKHQQENACIKRSILLAAVVNVEREGKGCWRVPDLVREEEEPWEVEEKGAEEEEDVSPGEALIAALHCDKAEEGNPQMKDEDAIVERGERSQQRAPNLSVDKD